MEYRAVTLVIGPNTVPLTVTFSNTTGGAAAYLWNFGDSANNVQKAIILETGITVQAPLFIKTGETFVFDQSHIFFDGAWGTALSEIMTNEALSWAHYLSMLPSPAPAGPNGLSH